MIIARTSIIERRKYHQSSRWLTLSGFSGMCQNPAVGHPDSATHALTWLREDVILLRTRLM